MEQLVILGSGTAVPTPRRGPAGYVLADADDATLIDPGPGALKRACDAGFPVERVSRVLLTHHHPDHCLDVAALLFARNVQQLDRICVRLAVLGPLGTRQLIDGFRHVFGAWVTLPPGRLEVIELDAGPFRLSDRIAAVAVPVEHSTASLGYRLKLSGGATLGLSGDSDVCEGAETVGRAADHFLLEAALPDDRHMPGHLTPTRAARLAARAGCRHLILTHFYPLVDTDRALDTARELFPGRVTIAEDGMRIPLQPLGES